MSVLNTLIVKFASRCNLACTYCYEYSAGDESWRTKPKLINQKIITQIGARIKEYAEQTGQSRINVVAHGGEPLLVGPKRLEQIFSTLLQSTVGVDVRLGVQTNGLLINPEICDILKKYDVLVGISLDGSKNQNQKRIDHQGNESWSKTINGIDILKRLAPQSYGGILCVVDTDKNAHEVLTSLCELQPKQIDFLQPFLTHDMAGFKREIFAKKFGNWMVQALHSWLDNPKHKDIKIRVFEDAFRAALGEKTLTDWFGLRKISYVVVEADGNYDLLDQLKIVGKDSIKYRQLLSNVFDTSLFEVSKAAEQLLKEFHGDTTPQECSGCKHEHTCAASHLTSRFSQDRGFANRSTYCEGLSMLLDEATSTIKMQYE